MGRLLDALGLKHRLVNRIVVVADVNAAVQVYVRSFVHEEEWDAIADNLVEPTTRGGEVQVTTVGGLEVDEQGRVFVPAAEVARMRRALERIADEGGSYYAAELARKALED